MPQQDASPGPLAKGWASMEAGLRKDKRRNDMEIEFARMCVYFGAKIALVAMVNSPMAPVLMSAELRDFDRYVKNRRDELAEESVCPAVNIS